MAVGDFRELPIRCLRAGGWDGRCCLATDEILVLIPAYRDRELAPTLTHLFDRAKAPGRLRVAVAWQHATNESLPKRLFRIPNLEIVSIPATQSGGPNWARRLLQHRYSGEPFTLLLDSHHRFVRHWDDKTLRIFDQLKAKSRKPILTAYLPPYNPRRDPLGRVRKVMKIYPLKRTNGLLTHLTGRPLVLDHMLRAPIPADYASLHFLFAEGKFHEEIKFDPEIYFFGDEVFTGLRAYTYGYDLFHPHKILGWHLYDRATRTTHWADHGEWSVLEPMSFQKMADIIMGRSSHQGLLSTRRSVRGYERMIGLKLVEQ